MHNQLATDARHCTARCIFFILMKKGRSGFTFGINKSMTGVTTCNDDKEETNVGGYQENQFNMMSSEQ